ncbi:hypothetical protein TNIN_288821 [Trichonephila inaurata madagascariensis]|uniref:Uncharacterized protein n=1 Tax=Trichonephila inaurata madagascariensis TaxID=2747483 RepID=A0A8X7BRQ6_9ARAC|nr:hypothetical protein TNIN_288821 [Trichonephila inaurata madagascariensis]
MCQEGKMMCIKRMPKELRSIAGAKELHLDNFWKDLEKDHTFIPLMKTDPGLVVPESMTQKRNQKKLS